MHRIGILDIRLFNTDRHAGNLLVKITKSPRKLGATTINWLEDKYSLIPIDHGFCLPEALEPPYLEWLHWPQVCHISTNRQPVSGQCADQRASTDLSHESLPG